MRTDFAMMCATRRRGAGPLLLAVLCAVALNAQTVVPIEKRGPATGTRAPEIHARDQFGHDQTIASLQGRNGLVLLFVRSADW